MSARVTALALLGYISAALLAQVMLAIVVVALRRNDAPPIPALPARAQGVAPAWSGVRPFRVRSRAFEDEAQSQASFYLEPVDALPLDAYKAGQFLTLQLDLPDAQGNVGPVTRCYSLSDCHDPAAYRLTIKRIPAPRNRPDLPPGLVSNYFHDHVVPGTIVQIRAPAGAFVLAAASDAAVLIAGGIGITPLFAMARAALAAQPDRTIHLFYGVRDSSEIVFETDLIALRERHPNFHLTIVQSAPLPGAANTPDESGFIDVALLRRLLPHGVQHFYVCGPPPMMASLVPALRDWGVAANAVHYEAFGPASIESAGAVIPTPLATPTEVHFTRSARTLNWTGEDANLLDFAERHGIEILSGCRSGSCGTCETPVTAGTVHYAQPPSYDVAPGACLMCVGVPDGDLVIDA
jgi:ferredoxin-NADP reductase